MSVKREGFDSPGVPDTLGTTLGRKTVVLTGSSSLGVGEVGDHNYTQEVAFLRLRYRFVRNTVHLIIAVEDETCKYTNFAKKLKVWPTRFR
jgi:hypothetical protein